MDADARRRAEEIRRDLLVAERPETIMFTAAKWRADAWFLLAQLDAAAQAVKEKDAGTERLHQIHLRKNKDLCEEIARLRQRVEIWPRDIEGLGYRSDEL